MLSSLRRHVDRADGLIGGQPADQALAGVANGIRLIAAEARGGFLGDTDPALVGLVEACEAIFGDPSDGTSELSRLERGFLLLADHVEPAQLSGCLSPLVHALLPDLLEQAEDRAHADRSLRLVPDSDGSGWTLQGRLDPECGERLHAFLSAQLVADHDPADTAAAARLRERGLDPHDPDLDTLGWRDPRAGDGEDAPRRLVPRSTRQKLHDALSTGLGQVLASDLLGQTHDKQPVQIVVTVAAETLDRQPGALPGRTGSGRPVSCRLIRRWACGSALTRHVLSLARHGHRRRATPSGPSPAPNDAPCTPRPADAARATGCTRSTRHPGTVLHPHHATPWALSGTTSLADTVHLCDQCHGHLHRGHPLRLRDGRRLGPDGWLPPPRE